MKKLLFFLLLMPLVMQAAWLNNEPVSITQPDGTVLQAYATGDEFYNWLHDENQFTIVQNQLDGYFYYAELQEDNLVPSVFRFGETDPFEIGLMAGLNISAAKRTEIRQRMESEFRFDNGEKAMERAAGQLNNIVIYIRFSDQDEFTSDTLINWNRFNATGSTVSSVFEYFREVSYYQLDVPSTFYPVPDDNIIRSYQDSFPRAYYMPYNAVTNPDGYQNENQRTQREHTLLANAVTYINLNSPVPDYIDLDYNNDGRVDNVVFIIRGGPTAWSTLLWPHRWSLYTQTVYINGKRVWDFNFQLETSLQSSGVGVLCHELYHSLGAPDLYRYVDNSITPVGPWDVMAANNNPPQYMGAFMRYKYGNWIDEIPMITEGGTYTLNPLSAPTNNVWAIPSQTSSTEYFVLEYRQKAGVYDGTLPKSGLLIYRINPAAGNGNAQGPPDEVYLFRPGGTPNGNGNLNDAVFGANYGRSAFSDDTNPYAFLQNGSLGGVYISEISAVGPTMSFRVDFPAEPQAAIAATVRNACIDDEIKLLDVSTGLPTSWNWIIQPSTFVFVNGTNAQSKNPEVQFTAEGSYNVSLHVTNSLGADIANMNDFIIIGGVDSYFEDDFESLNFMEGSWMIENPDNNVTWGMHAVSGNGGVVAAGINFRNYYAIGQRDRLISKPFDFTNFASVNFNFEHAYAQNADITQYSDSLIVLVSTDCGENWMRIASLGENGSGNFATHPPTAEAFFPEVAEDWCGNGWGSPCNSFDLSFLAGQSNVRFAFETVSFYGNPILIDNVVVSQYLDTPEKAEVSAFSVYPNPSEGMVRIENPAYLGEQFYELTDLQGRRIVEGRFESALELNLRQVVGTGTYLLHLTNKSEVKVVKLLFK